MTPASRLTRELNRRLTAEEARRYLDAPITEAERTAARELITWFTRRYPTPAARLAYARRAYARWTRTHVISPNVKA